MRWKLTMVAVLALEVGGCGSVQPTGDTTLAEVVIDMGDALRAVQEETSMLQAQVDSLREVTARQDTVLRRLASMAGMPIPGP